MSRGTYERVGKVTITHSGAKWEVELPPGVSTVGRSYDGTTNLINLPADDLSISRVHAEIENTGRAFIIRNKSANGTLLNGQSINEQELNMGDRVRIGAAELAFAMSAPQPAAPASGIRLGTASAAPAHQDEHTPGAGATEAFDSDALRKMNLSVQQQELIAKAKATYRDNEPTAEGPSVEEEPVAKVNVGYEVKQSAAQAARQKAKQQVKAKAKESEAPKPMIIILGVVGLVLLLLIIVISPSEGVGDGTIEQGAALKGQYEHWLTQQEKDNPDVDVNKEEKLAELDNRIKAISWAERVGRSEEVRRSLNVLLQMDADRSSPVYQYAAGRLRGM